MPAKDVQHHWNSTYKMLDTSINIKTQLSMWAAGDRDISKFQISEDERDFAIRLRDFLRVSFFLPCVILIDIN